MHDMTKLVLATDPRIKAFATPGKGEELVPWTYYERQAHSAAAMAASTQYFNSVPANSSLGNMELGSQIPNPKRFLVTTVRVQVNSIIADSVDTASVTAADIQNDVAQVLYQTQVEFRLGDKLYLKVPTYRLPAGSGQVLGGNDNITASTYAHSTNGAPFVANGYFGAWPIPANTSFAVFLLSPLTPTLGNALSVTIHLDGWLIRPWQ